MDKQIILITGTRKGIGKALAEHYIGLGHTVIGCSRGEVNFAVKNYTHFSLDIIDERSVKMMFSYIKKSYNRLDVLINNAGINLSLSPMLLVSYKSALRTLETNFLGTFLMSREAVRIMMKNSYGRIINFGSMAVRHEVKGEAIYTASKAAVISYTRVMAKEIYDYGITCNVIAPSALQTDLIDSIDIKELENVLQRNAIHGLGKMEDIYSVADFLIEKKSKAITGQVIYLGGV